MKKDSDRSVKNVLQTLYQIASRRSHDPYEGLAIQLQDGLQTMVGYWGMLVGMVTEVDQESVSIADYYMRPFESSTLAPREVGSFIEPSPTCSRDMDTHRMDGEELRANPGRAGPILEPHAAEIVGSPKDEYLVLTSQMVEMKASAYSIRNSYSAQLILAPSMIALNDTLPPPSIALSDEPWDKIMAKSRRYLGMPLVTHERLFGTLSFFSTEPSNTPFMEDDQELLQLFGEWVGSLLERTQSRSLRATEQSDLARINKEIAQSNSDLDHFVYIASHDLKEPLRGISQYAQFLTEDYYAQLDDEGKRMLTALIDQSQRMVKQIDDLRFYSRIGRHESGIDLIDLNDIVADVRATLHALLSETGVGIRIPRSLPSIRGNAALITTVFQNLMANAARYNDKEHKWIQISWRYRATSAAADEPQTDDTESGNDGTEERVLLDENKIDDVASVLRSLQEGKAQIVLTIADNGIGIGERDQEAIFTMFRRLHNQDDFGGGTGAGLAIVKRILEQEGGQIWLESTLGVGTQFHFTFE